MTQIDLDVVAAVPKVAQCDFVDAALRAKANCPISRHSTPTSRCAPNSAITMRPAEIATPELRHAPGGQSAQASPQAPRRGLAPVYELA